MAVPAIADGDTIDYALNQENEKYITRNGRVHEKVRKLELLTRQVASSYHDESRGLQYYEALPHFGLLTPFVCLAAYLCAEMSNGRLLRVPARVGDILYSVALMNHSRFMFRV